MKSGKLNKRIVIQSKETVKINGRTVEQYKENATVWAYVTNLSTREFIQAQGTQAELNKKFHIRYFKGLDNTMLIKYNNKIFEIVNIDNVDEANVEMWILGKCIENG